MIQSFKNKLTIQLKKSLQTEFFAEHLSFMDKSELIWYAHNDNTKNNIISSQHILDKSELTPPYDGLDLLFSIMPEEDAAEIALKITYTLEEMNCPIETRTLLTYLFNDMEL